MGAMDPFDTFALIPVDFFGYSCHLLVTLYLPNPGQRSRTAECRVEILPVLTIKTSASHAQVCYTRQHQQLFGSSLVFYRPPIDYVYYLSDQDGALHWIVQLSAGTYIHLF